MKHPFLILIIAIYSIQSTTAQINFQTRWQNRLRNAIVYLPKNFSESENLPVVINMHGFLTNARFQFDYTQFHKTADSVRCIVIYPEGVDLRWNSGTFFFVPSTVDDVGFLSDWMDRAAVLYNANLKKVYAMGYSAGGFMSYKLACDLTNRVAAIAPDVASMVNDNLNSCVPGRPINIEAFNGLSDPITAYNGFPGNFPGIDSIKHFWQLKNGCDEIPLIDTLPDIRIDGTRVVRYTYQHCSQQVQQVYYKVINGGHVWPGAANIFLDVLGKTTQHISMNTEAWNFFSSKEIPPSVQCDAPANLQATTIAVDSFVLSWSAVAGVSSYKVGIADDSSHVTFYETTNTTLGIKINPLRQIKWNVASLCSSGFHNWNTSRALNFTPTGIRQNAAQKISIFPNPVTDDLYVDIPKNGSGNVKCSIYNAVGDEILSNASLFPDNKIDVRNLAKGWYQLVITGDEKVYEASFIKK